MEGRPQNPTAWLISVALFKFIDATRRQSRFDAATARMTEQLHPSPNECEHEAHEVVDDRLGLTFTCCQPALSTEAQLALTLREVCGLTTEAIAHAFLTRPSMIAQRM